MKKIVLVLLILVMIGGSAFAFDISTFPSPITKNSMMLSPTFSIGGSGLGGWAYSGWSTTLAGTLSFDYALPIPFALAVGTEVGVAGIMDDYTEGLAIPVFLRVSWHPNFEVRGLDPYITTKVGYSFNTWEYGTGGFSYGFNLGMRYFFNSNIGIFGELGYDRYSLGYEFDLYGIYSYSWSYYMYTFFHVGVTFRFGGSGGGGSSASSSSRGQSQSGRYMVVNADSLNVRSGPSADNPVVGTVARNNRVEILNSSGQWWRIRYGNVEGYVNSSYLIPEN